MNGKMHSETGAFTSDGMRAEILNPFVHKLELDNTFDKIKVILSFRYCELRDFFYWISKYYSVEVEDHFAQTRVEQRN